MKKKSEKPATKGDIKKAKMEDMKQDKKMMKGMKKEKKKMKK